MSSGSGLVEGSRRLGAALTLWRVPRRSREDVRRIQSRRLSALLRHCRRRVPFQAERMARAGLEPGSDDPLEELARLAPVSKLELRRRPAAELRATGLTASALMPHSTSGSAGIRLEFRRNALEDHLLQLYRFRAWLDHGIRPRDRLALLDTEHRHPPPRFLAGRWRQRLGIFRSRRFDGRLDPDLLLDELASESPEVIVGYAGLVAEVARRAAERGGAGFRPKAVLCGGETLAAATRRAIARGFGAPVYDDYGAAELNLLAWQCRETGLLHVLDDALVLEVLDVAGDPASEGGEGEVVVTGLHDRATPFLRYRMGDLAVRGPAPCPCGAPFSTLAGLRGRTVELYDRPDGGVVLHWTLSSALMDGTGIADAVDRYQIVQETERRVVFRVTLRRELTREEQTAVRAAAWELLGPEVELVIRRETHLPISRSGKMLQSRNLLREARHGSAWDPASHDPLEAP